MSSKLALYSKKCKIYFAYLYIGEGVHVILRHKLLSLLVILSVVFLSVGNVTADMISYTARTDKFELMWNNAEDSERYYMSTDIKAYACGLTTSEFIFFARVVEGEGADSDADITDKVLVAATVLNRINCSSWPPTTVMGTLQRPGQFEVVDQETGECHCARSLDSEWAIVIAYRMVANNELDCHMVYYNAIGFTGYSRTMTDYAYFGGNYFSCIPCDCAHCTETEPDWHEEDVEMLTDLIYRPDGVGPNYF